MAGFEDFTARFIERVRALTRDERDPVEMARRFAEFRVQIDRALLRAEGQAPADEIADIRRHMHMLIDQLEGEALATGEPPAPEPPPPLPPTPKQPDPPRHAAPAAPPPQAPPHSASQPPSRPAVPPGAPPAPAAAAESAPPAATSGQPPTPAKPPPPAPASGRAVTLNRPPAVVPAPAARAAVVAAAAGPKPFSTRPAPESGPIARVMAATAGPARPAPPLLHWLRTVWVLLIRVVKLEGTRDQIGFVWIVARPMFQIGIFMALLIYLDARTLLDMSREPFVVLGVVTWFAFSQSVVSGMNVEIVDGNMRNFPHVSRIELAVARSLFFATTAAILAVFWITVLYRLGYSDRPEDIMRLFGLWVTTWFFGLSLGLVIGFTASRFPDARRVYVIVQTVLFYMSGLFYAPEMLPAEALDVVIWNPVLHLVCLVRDAFFETYRSDIASPAYLGGWFVVLLLAALATDRLARRRVERA